jgi:putative ABC transport system permease protein
MLKNKWMVICLLIGSVILVGLLSSLPIYTDGIMQRMLIKDLENLQKSDQIFPGSYSVTNKYGFGADDVDGVKAFRLFDERIKEKFVTEFKIPVLANTTNLFIRDLNAIPQNKKGKIFDKSIQLETISEFEKHISISQGRLYKNLVSDNTYEVVVTEEALRKLDVPLNEILNVSRYSPEKKNESLFKIKVVGVFTIKDPNDPFWSKSLESYSNSVFVDFELFSENFLKEGLGLLSNASWHYALNYHKIRVSDLDRILNIYDSQKKWFQKYGVIASMEMSSNNILKEYGKRAGQLRITLLVLVVPVLIILVFYIFMISRLVIKHDENEIALIKSRGASNTQIFMIYLVEALVISGVSIILGPPLGLFICKLLGASNGFMEFVSRTQLPVSLTIKSYLYSFFALLLFIATMLIPALKSSRVSIVEHKQKKARTDTVPFYKRFYLDFVLIFISAYGLYRYKDRNALFGTDLSDSSNLTIDPLLFLITTIFILGIGLLFLRTYPYFINYIFKIRIKKWSPVPYLSFIQVSRSKGEEQFLMIFIILSLSIGIFNSSTAKTINKNIEDNVRYLNGADITLKEKWQHNKTENYVDVIAPGFLVTSKFEDVFRWFEPDFRKYETMPGVLQATKVFINNDSKVQINGEYFNPVTVMGIAPNEFGKVAWFRKDLLSFHINQYLNLMTKNPKALILSRSFEKKYRVKVGDTIDISWNENNYISGTVYSFVDYWPGFNNSLSQNQSPNLVICNLDYIQSEQIVEPYQIWVKAEADTKDKDFDDNLRKKNIEIESISYKNQLIVKKKNDPMLQGTNGMLTLGFIVNMLITAIGFLIYWILSIKGRILQFGILRAMGMSQGRVIGLIIFEQIMISLISVIAGFIIGGISSEIFIPLMQILYSTSLQVLPFSIALNFNDYIKVIVSVITMFIICLCILRRIIISIRIDQAVKLGED